MCLELLFVAAFIISVPVGPAKMASVSATV